MTEQIINSDGSRNWQANILLDNITRLEQENKELKEENIKVKKEFNNLIAEIISDIEYTGVIACNGETPLEHLHKCQKALKALKEIKEVASFHTTGADNEDVQNDMQVIINKINEVLQ